jgi:BMFP domain-containing protein YqiC
MSDRPRFFDDLAGVAGGAFSALAGVREEVGAVVRARVDEVLSTLNLVRREEFEVVRELASRARAAQEDAEGRLSALEARIAALEAGTDTFPE